jgi:hypothetical protein
MSETATSAGLLKRGLVVTKDTMQVPGKKMVLDLPSVGYELRFSTADIREMPPEHFKVFASEYGRQFNAQFAFLRRTWFADMRKLVRQTEVLLKPLGFQAGGDVPAATREMRPIVERANDDLRHRCATYADALQEHGQACYQAALRAAWRTAKRRSGRSTVKVTAEFELTAPVPPAAPLSHSTRYVVMPTPGRR